METYTLEQATLILSRDQQRRIALDYINALFREAAHRNIIEYAETSDAFSYEDMEEVADEVFSTIIGSSLVWDRVEQDLWIDTIAEKEAEIKRRNEE